MPLYEYGCESCGLQFEIRQKFSDNPVTECSKCGGSVKKLISQGGFALKGNGWFQQGYSEKPACSTSGGGGCEGCPKAANG